MSLNPHELALLRNLRFPGDAPTIWDVGANVGAYARAVLERWPAASVRCFEPMPESAAALRAAVPGAEVHQCAVSWKNGETTIYFDGDRDETASLHQRDLGEGRQHGSRSLAVETMRLDALRPTEPVHLLKIDAEGHELEVLRGAGGYLAPESIHVIQFEFNDCALESRIFIRDFFRLLIPRGYALFLQVPAGGLERIERYEPALENYHAHREFVAMDPGGVYYVNDTAWVSQA